MTLPTSGPLTFTDIQTEFGGSNPIGINEYYAGGGLVAAGTSGTYGAVPSSGQISVQNFYGTSAVIPAYIEEVFSTYLFTGTGAALTITNGVDLSTNGGLVWIKSRSPNADNHRIFDTARGVNYALSSSTSGASSSLPSSLTAFNSNGFTLGTNSSVNPSTWDMVSWAFQKKAKFFDIVTYTGTGVARTIAHNLGSVPGCIIVKRTSDSGTGWWVYHRGNTSGGAAQGQDLRLNQTNATNPNTDVWNNTAPTSSVFSIGAGSSPYDWNGTGGTFIAYLFAHNAGGFGATGTDNVISCGSFTTDASGNASVTLGYEPQWLMTKSSSTASSGSWYMQDNMRGWVSNNPGSNDNKLLYANAADAEGGGGFASLNATGFTFASGGYGPWANATFIYIAIRRGPMKVPTDATTVYGAVARSGTGASASITSLSFPPDLLIDKARNAGYEPSWWDRLRGTNRVLLSSTNNQETVTTDSLNAFGQTGVSIGADSGGYINNASATYINWFFRRAPSFFDEVCYTGTGSAQNVTHNLTVAPELVIIKSRSNGGSGYGWVTGSSYYPSWGRYIQLDTTDAVNGSNNAGPFNNTAPTSSVFTVNTWSETNNSGSTYVAYLFATCAGVSKVGSYTGTGALLTVNCGFTTGVRWVMIKRTDSTGGWYVYDSTRGISSGNDPYLFMNATNTEVTGTNYVDTTSVGFQVTAAAPAALNANGGTFVFLAIA